ncbi:43_t:CDS:2 [Paraglomus brasilianum]|uniref:43_t:CDS:1 n=1 Tax=Paraglomus brasilianum TaxID=144538 RepID=A0A9N8ZKZ0_9GLOM|nr:43_t:CDS:2 [Paraglomus brasilianum]
MAIERKMLMRLRKKKPDYVIFQAQQRQSNLDISGLLTTIQITINALITKSILGMADWILWRALGRYIVYLDIRLDNVDTRSFARVLNLTLANQSPRFEQ